jgi:hypothetical protein
VRVSILTMKSHFPSLRVCFLCCRMVAEARRRWITAASDPRSAAQWAMDPLSRSSTPASCADSLVSVTNGVDEASQARKSRSLGSRVSLSSWRSQSPERRAECRPAGHRQPRPESSFTSNSVATHDEEQDTLVHPIMSRRTQSPSPERRRPGAQRRSRHESSFEIAHQIIEEGSKPRPRSSSVSSRTSTSIFQARYQDTPADFESVSQPKTKFEPSLDQHYCYMQANFEDEGLRSQSINSTVSTASCSSPGPPSKSPEAVDEPKFDPRYHVRGHSFYL